MTAKQLSYVSSNDTSFSFRTKQQSTSFHLSPLSFSQNKEDNTWPRKRLFSPRNNEFYCVTIFGYTNDNRKGIISSLKMMGNIVEYKEESESCLNVKYCTAKEAHYALQLNGALINGNIIGVKVCENKEFCRQHIEPTRTKLEEEEVEVEVPKKSKNWVNRLMEYTFTW